MCVNPPGLSADKTEPSLDKHPVGYIAQPEHERRDLVRVYSERDSHRSHLSHAAVPALELLCQEHQRPSALLLL